MQFAHRIHREHGHRFAILLLSGVVLVGSQSTDGDMGGRGAQPRVANRWRAEALDSEERRALDFVDTLVESNMPELLIAGGIFLFVVTIAWTLPDLVAFCLVQFQLRERLTRYVTVPLFWILLGLAVVIALVELEVDIKQIIFVTGVIGVVLGIGFAADIANVVGWSLMPSCQFVEIGNEVQIGDKRGVIERIGMRHITLVDYSTQAPTVEPVRHLVPNSEIGQRGMTLWGKYSKLE